MPLALQHCFGLPYWHYQPLFRCFDSPPSLSLFVSKNLENWEEKENCFQKSHKSRRERDFFLKFLKIEKRKRFVFQNLINREEKEKFFLKILKIKKRKRMDLKISQIKKRNRIFFLKILKIENRKRNENLIFSSERENKESFLLEIFRDRDSCQWLKQGIPGKNFKNVAQQC